MVVPSVLSYTYKTLAIFRFFSAPKYYVEPIVVTILSSMNSSTKACFPEQLISAHVSSPGLQPVFRSGSINVGRRNLSMWNEVEVLVAIGIIYLSAYAVVTLPLFIRGR